MRIAIAFLLALLAVGASVPAAAERAFEPSSPPPMEEPWRWRLFPELAGVGLRCLAESMDGVLWAGTDSGLRSYDGESWEDFELGWPVNSLLVDSSDRLWVASDQGIFRLEEGIWLRVFPSDPELPWPVDDLLEGPDHAIWAATAWGLLQIAEGHDRLFTSADMAAAIASLPIDLEIVEIPDELLPETRIFPGPGLALATGGFVGHLRGNHPQSVWAVVPGSPAESAGIRTGDLILAVDGEEGGARVRGPAGSETRLKVMRKGFEVEETTLQRIDSSASLREAPVYDLLLGENHELWLGMVHGEILRCEGCFDRSGTPRWQAYGMEDGLVLDSSPRLARTPDGSIWAVTDGTAAGFQRFDGARWRGLDLGGPTERVHTSALVDGEGTLWVAGQHLFRYADGEWGLLTARRSPLDISRARLFPASDGSFWIASREHGAAQFRGLRRQILSLSELAFQVRDRTGRRWFIGADLRVVLEDGDRWTSFGPEDGVVDDPSAVFVTRDDRVWVAGGHGDEAAVSVLEDSAWKRVILPSFAREVSRTAILEDRDGHLWLGGSGGLIQRGGGLLRLDSGAAGESDEWEVIRGGAVPLLVRSLMQDSEGDIWAAGNQVARLHDGQWRRVDLPLESSEDSVHTVQITAGGLFFVGASRGQICELEEGDWHCSQLLGTRAGPVQQFFQPPNGQLHALAGSKIFLRRDGEWHRVHYPVLDVEATAKIDPRVEGDAVWVNSLGSGDLALHTVRLKIEEDPPETRILTGTTTVSLGDPATMAWTAEDPWHDSTFERLRYSWRLDGGSWSSFDEERQQLFFDLEPGEHLLEVRSADSFLNVDPTPASFSFRVVPPLWRRSWFRAALVSIAGLILFQWVLILRRNRTLQRLNSALRQSRDRMEERVENRTAELAESNRRLQEQISERNEAEEALRLSEERYRSFVASSQEGIGRIEIVPPVPIDLPIELQLGWMREHAILAEANEALARSLGIKESEVPAGGLPKEILELATGQRKVLEKMIRGDYRLDAVESSWMDSDGTKRYFLDTVTGDLEDGHMVRFWWTRTEITERRLIEKAQARQQRELAHADKMISLGTLVSGVAHEISNPNQFMMLNLPVLRDVWRDAEPFLERCSRDHPDMKLANMPFDEAREEVSELVDEVLEGCHRIKSIVSDLREYARDDGTRPEGRIDVNRAVEASLRLVGNTIRKSTDRFQVELAGELPDLQGNTRQIEQVVINLVLNACQALTARSEAVRVRTELDERSGGVAIVVEDEGRGIAEEDLPHLTDPFFTRKRDSGGSGLGLSVSARIVEEHGGRLIFESMAPRGTRARLVLPSSLQLRA